MKSLLKWAPALAIAMLSALLGRKLPGWGWMCVIVLALFFAAKWITIFELFSSKESAGIARLLGYCFLWPGMDARAFCAKGSALKPSFEEWALAGGKTLLGAALLWAGVPCLEGSDILIRGWVGMIGLIFLFHFGLLHVVSLLWRVAHVDAEPIMRSPGTATSVSVFWSKAWNIAFSDLMSVHFFKPLTKPFGPRGALFSIFILSGLLHELVISVPARGGYGLPTLYFAIQAAGLMFERSVLGQILGLRSGWRGWCFVALLTGVPAFLLFHPIFVYRVILPMLNVMHAN